MNNNDNKQGQGQSNQGTEKKSSEARNEQSTGDTFSSEETE